MAGKKDAAAQKRSAAAKKAAATRKANEQAQENDQSADQGVAPDEQADQPQVQEYQPYHAPLQAAGLDQVAAEEQRQAELQAQRDEHNRRTGGQ